MNPKATALTTAITALHRLTTAETDVLVKACDDDPALRSLLLERRSAAAFAHTQARSPVDATTGMQKAEHLAALVQKSIRLTLDAPMERLTALEALKDQVRSLNDRVLELEATKAATSGDGTVTEEQRARDLQQFAEQLAADIDVLVDVLLADGVPAAAGVATWNGPVMSSRLICGIDAARLMVNDLVIGAGVESVRAVRRSATSWPSTT